MTHPTKAPQNLSVNPKAVNKQIKKAVKNAKIENHQLQEILRKINFDFQR